MALRRSSESVGEIVVRGWAVCLIVLVTAAGMLWVDLGSPQRVLLLFLSPTASAITVGAFVLAVDIVIAACFVGMASKDAGQRMYRGPERRTGTWALGVAGIVSGVITACYTGFLLSQMASVVAWQTPLVPLLFLLSSLSCGYALLCGVSSPFFQAFFNVRAFRNLGMFDVVCVISELVVVVAYIVWCTSDSQTSAAAAYFLQGEAAPWFYLCLVGIGMVVPVIVDVLIRRMPSQMLLVIVCVCVLVGGLTLRWCIVGVGSTDPTQTSRVMMGYLPLAIT